MDFYYLEVHAPLMGNTKSFCRCAEQEFWQSWTFRRSKNDKDSSSNCFLFIWPFSEQLLSSGWFAKEQE